MSLGHQFAISSNFFRETIAFIFKQYTKKFIKVIGPRGTPHPDHQAFNATAKCLGYEFGWIQKVTLYSSTDTMEILHFGITKNMLRRGVGTAFVNAFIDIMRTSHNVNQFVFYIPAGSEKESFLRSLGGVLQGNAASGNYVIYTI